MIRENQHNVGNAYLLMHCLFLKQQYFYDLQITQTINASKNNLKLSNLLVIMKIDSILNFL